MKNLLLALLVLVVGVSMAGDKPAKKFKVTYTITYEALTLQEAAGIEKSLRCEYQNVDVKIGEVEHMVICDTTSMFQGRPYILPYWNLTDSVLPKSVQPFYVY